MIKDLKICGISDPKTLNYILDHPFPPKFIGFITNYKKSKRYVAYKNLKNLVNVNKKDTYFVSVLVNPTNELLEKIKDLKFDYYQLYDVDPSRTFEIREKYKIKIISAITVSNKKDVDRYKDYLKISDIILFDSKGYHRSESFDHNLLEQVPSEVNKMIAGNIQIDDIPNLIKRDYIIDLSGSIENNEGKKDINKIDRLLKLVAKYET
mgnify:CR=1 FL=1